MLLSELPFEPIGDNSPGPSTGFSIAGVDIANMYAPASAGAAYGGSTGFYVAGADIGSMFAAVGSTKKLYNTWIGTYTEATAGQLSVGAVVSVKFLPTGFYETIYGTGRWLAPNLDAAEYEIIAEPTEGTFDINTMAAFAQINIERKVEISVSVGPTPGYISQTAKGLITIRKITEPDISISGSVTLIASAQSYGSTPPP